MLISKLFKFKNLKRILLNPHLILIRLYYNLIRFVSDIGSFFGKYNYKYKIIFIAGMPMSATTLVKNMFGYIPGYFTRYAPMPDLIANKGDITDSAFHYSPKWTYTLFKTHLNPLDENIEIIKRNNVNKVIVTYRDLRDVALSRYYRLLEFPKKKTEHNYKDYANLTKEEAIDHSILIIANEFIPWINGWIKISKENKNFVHFCSFENLRTDPEKELIKMLEFYEIKISQKLVNKIIDKTKGKKSMSKNMKESVILPWARASNFRSGKIGGWKDEFTEQNKNNFKKLTGNFLIEHKYENNNNW